MAIAPPCHTRTSASTDSWITPKWLLDRLGAFDLDPCASDPQPWPTAERMLTERDDGLLARWQGAVYCNPPYGKSLGAWLNRCALHNNTVVLVFARTETRAFFANVWPHATGMLFLCGRLTFYKPDGEPSRVGANSGGPSVLIAYGEAANNRLLRVRDLGAYVSLNQKVIL